MRFGALLMLGVLASTALAQVSSSPGYSVADWPAAPTITPSSPLLTTPLVTSAPFSSPVGATNATGNNVAGASNSTLLNFPGAAAASSFNGTYPGFWSASSGYEQAPAPGTPMTPAAPVGFSSSALGSMQTASAYNGAFAPPGQLTIMQAALLARERGQTPQNIRTYTNGDIDRIRRQSGVKLPAHRSADDGTPGYTVATAVDNEGGITGTMMLDRNLGVDPDSASESGSIASQAPPDVMDSQTAATPRRPSSHDRRTIRSRR